MQEGVYESVDSVLAAANELHEEGEIESIAVIVKKEGSPTGIGHIWYAWDNIAGGLEFMYFADKLKEFALREHEYISDE